jgi:hypothetical protein
VNQVDHLLPVERATDAAATPRGGGGGDAGRAVLHIRLGALVIFSTNGNPEMRAV